MPTEAIIFPILFLSFFGVLAFWIHSRQRRSRELLDAQMQLQTRILERFDSQAEFASFLQSEGGQRFLTGLTDERGWRPAKKILFALQAGIVVTCFGLGLCVLSWAVGEKDPLYPAIVILFLGLGFLLAAAASYRLSKSWGLMPEDRRPTLHELTEG